MKVGDTYNYAFDANGNMTDETTSRHFEWDHSDRMRVFRNQVDGSQPTVYALYFYDSDGQRVKKIVRKQNGAPVEATVYIGGLFERHTRVQGGVLHHNNTLHVMDDEKRIALVRVGNPLDANDNSPKVQYHLGDHLGSSNLVVGADGIWTNREEFTPYGETSFGSFAKKRYRFTGKELDACGLYYFGARYYDPTIGRFITPDPLNTYVRELRVASSQNLNPYSYVQSNPVSFTDPFGLQIRRGAEEWVPEGFVQTESGIWADPVTPSNSPRSEGASNIGVEKYLKWSGEIARNYTQRSFTASSSMVPTAGLFAAAGAAILGLMAAPAGPVLAKSALGPLSRAYTSKWVSELGYAGTGVGLGYLGYSGGSRLQTVSPVFRWIGTDKIERDFVVVATSVGRQAFYRSSGTSSRMAGRWLPFDEIVTSVPNHLIGKIPRGWINKAMYAEFPSGHALHRLASEEFKAISDALGKMQIPRGAWLFGGKHVNQILDFFRARITPANITRSGRL